MVVDTSAIIAIVFKEPEAQAFRRLIESHPHPVMSAASHAEAGIVVMQRLSLAALDDLAMLLEGAGVEIVTVTPNTPGSRSPRTSASARAGTRRG